MTGFDIPLEVIDAARLVAHWFDEKGIKDWELCGVKSRTQWKPIETVPEKQRVLLRWVGYENASIVRIGELLFRHHEGKSVFKLELEYGDAFSVIYTDRDDCPAEWMMLP